MATIITKNSSTASSVPTAAQLVKGELAVNVTDKRLFTENASGTVVELGTNPSSLTLPNGVANGVCYLNGSKVLTTGSALTFDGTNLGIGSSSPAGKLEVNVGSSAAWFTRVAGDVGTTNAAIGFLTTTTTGQIRSYGDMLFYTTTVGGTIAERMRLGSSGNLSVGATSNPASKFGVIASSASVADLYRTGAAGEARLNFYNDNASSAATVAGRVAALLTTTTAGAENGALLFGTTAAGTTAERMRIDSAGNVGIGVTPSVSWWASMKSIGVGRLGNGVFGATNDDEINIGANVINTGSGTYIYGATDTASLYRQIAAQHVWYYAGSGTAGAALTLTEAMRIDSSGNVGIGTSSPGTRLDVSGNLRFSAANPVIELNNGGAQVYSTVANTLQFASGGGIGSPTERARIDSSGNLLVGTTSATINPGVRIEPGTNSAVHIGHSSAAVSGSSFAVFRYNGTAIGYIDQNGTTGVTFATTSDYRLKEQVQPMTGALAKVAALKPCTYKWKADGSEGEGFIAHELAEVVPQCVTGEKDAVDAEGNPVYQGIDTSFLVATLTAAIQELKAELDSVKSELASLKG